MSEKLDVDNLIKNLQKYRFAKTETERLGYKFTQTGILSRETKTAAILTIPPPSKLKSLRFFLGSMHHISKFTPHLAQLCRPLRPLRKNLLNSSGLRTNKTFQCHKCKIAFSTENSQATKIQNKTVAWNVTLFALDWEVHSNKIPLTDGIP